VFAEQAYLVILTGEFILGKQGMNLAVTDSVKPNCCRATPRFGYEMVSIALGCWNKAFAKRTNEWLLDCGCAMRRFQGSLKPLNSSLHQVLWKFLAHVLKVKQNNKWIGAVKPNRCLTAFGVAPYQALACLIAELASLGGYAIRFTN
jgi:hypothetical protein